MLVLTRKLGEAIVIPDLEVTIRVVEIRGDKVRLGIEAPTELAVHRQEVWERIRQFSTDESVVTKE
jgi:carbon storage regulator